MQGGVALEAVTGRVALKAVLADVVVSALLVSSSSDGHLNILLAFQVTAGGKPKTEV